MQKSILGNTGIEVSRLCLGSLTMSPLQAHLPVSKGADIIKYAFDKGINFLDTAELYDNYAYIAEALKHIERSKYVIATKSYSYSKETAEKSLNKALKELNTDYIDIFLLHEQESEHTIRGHYEAIEFFLKAKEKGIIRATGLSTHRVDAVIGSLKYDELQVIHPIVNKVGLGIQDGNVTDMIEAIKAAHKKGKGIYGMKPLGGGHLIKSVEEAMEFVKNIPFLHSIAIGMQCFEEVDANINLMEHGYIPLDIKNKLGNKTRKLQIADWCLGCGECAKVCKHGGIEIIDNKAVVVEGKCVLCGYCAAGCPEFCIKVI
jgi:predicted aldo/keto reductase-like oxidoreductase